MMRKKRSAEKTVRDIRRATRKHYSAEEKIRIVLEGLRDEASHLPYCRTFRARLMVFNIFHRILDFSGGAPICLGNVRRQCKSCLYELFSEYIVNLSVPIGSITASGRLQTLPALLSLTPRGRSDQTRRKISVPRRQ